MAIGPEGMGADEVAHEVQRRMSEDGGQLTKVAEQNVTVLGNSLAAILNDSACTFLELEQGDDYVQYVDIELGAVITIFDGGRDSNE